MKEVQQEDLLQAVLLADSFNDNLFPHAVGAPLALMSLVNCPLLEYALSYLEGLGVNQCFIYSCKYTTQLKEYLGSSKWCQGGSVMSLNLQIAEDCWSVGDVMRDLDAKALIQSDFLLMSVDCVTNYDVKPVWKTHSAIRKSTDRGAAMTLVCRAANPDHRARVGLPQLLLVADSEDQRLLHHQRLSPLSGRAVKLPLSMFDEHGSVEVRYDLLDASLWVCSPCVPLLFTDNFDFQTPDDFIHGLLINEEITGNSVYYSCVEGGYVSSVDSLQALENVTRDVLNLRVYPVLPGHQRSANIRCTSRNVYRHSNAVVGSGTSLAYDVYLAGGVRIGCDCTLTGCVLDDDVIVADACHLERSLIGCGSRLGRGVRLSRTLIGRGVQLGDDVSVGAGCVLGDGVQVQAGCCVPPGTLLAATPDLADAASFGARVSAETAVSVVGERGVGHLVSPAGGEDQSDDEDDDDERPAGAAPLPWAVAVPRPRHSVSSTDDSQSEQADDEDPLEDTDQVDRGDSPAMDDTKLFYSEVLDSLVRGYNEKISSENLILEVNSSKFAYNVTSEELNGLVVKAVMCVPEHASDVVLPAIQYWNQLRAALLYFKPLLANYFKSQRSMMQCLTAVERFCYTHTSASLCLSKLLQLLYQQDVLTEETIISWFRQEDAASRLPEAVDVRKQAARFVQWLEEADEESDSDSDD